MTSSSSIVGHHVFCTCCGYKPHTPNVFPLEMCMFLFPHLTVGYLGKCMHRKSKLIQKNCLSTFQCGQAFMVMKSLLLWPIFGFVTGMKWLCSDMFACVPRSTHTVYNVYCSCTSDQIILIWKKEH